MKEFIDINFENKDLTKIEIYPKDHKESQKERKLVFEYGLINISGECSKATILNPWINQLKKMEWVKEVTEVNYNYDENEQKRISFERFENCIVPRTESRCREPVRIDTSYTRRNKEA